MSDSLEMHMAHLNIPVWKASKRAEFLSWLGWVLRVEARSEKLISDCVHLLSCCWLWAACDP